VTIAKITVINLRNRSCFENHINARYNVLTVDLATWTTRSLVLIKRKKK